METWFDEAEAVNKIQSSLDGESYYWKYVRINGKYLFTDATNIYSPAHRSALKEGEKPESAAFVKIKTHNGQEVRVEGWSMTLKIGPTQDDELRLTRLLRGEK